MEDIQSNINKRKYILYKKTHFNLHMNAKENIVSNRIYVYCCVFYYRISMSVEFHSVLKGTVCYQSPDQNEMSEMLKTKSLKDRPTIAMDNAIIQD